MRVRQLVNCHCCPRRSGSIEIPGVRFIEAAKIVHIDQKAAQLDQVIQGGIHRNQNVPDVFNNRRGLGANIQVGDTQLIHLNALKAVIGASGTGARNIDKIAGALHMGKAAPGYGLMR